MAESQSTPGKLIVISGPAGAGKSTVVGHLFARFPERLHGSVSATTRPPRPGEQDGVHYHFLSPEEFHKRREAGEFLECFEVFGRGYWYGTLLDEVTPSLEAGQSVILEIDVDGAGAVLERFPDALTIFIHAGSLEELERRLRKRKTETEESIQRRLEVARRELERARHYRHQIENRDADIGQTVDEIAEIVNHYLSGGSSE